MPTTFEDHQAIRVLTARYNQAADAGDLDAYAACFTENGILELPGLATLQGPEALKAMIAALGFPTRHMTSDAIIEVDGDYATQTCAFVLYGRARHQNELKIVTTCRYEDQLARTPNGWRFTKRIAHADNDLAAMLTEIHPRILEALSAMAG
jgi:uncharacterized protein (TIGR02246 family)